ncbi:MAG: sialate O-acetylesterase [Paraglaciecola sp.]|jgi:sialate O-acetylesterase
MKNYLRRLRPIFILACTVIANSLIGVTLHVTAAQSASSMSNTLSLPAIFASHMVLQRNKPVVIWGNTQAGKKVTVTLNLAADKQISRQGMSGNDGQWQITLPPQAAGGPYALIIKDDMSHIKVDDVLVGDVWLASGQSNMEWKLGWNVEGGPAEIATSEMPNIRFFNVDNNFAASEQTHIPSPGWQLASPQTSPEFSAIAWFFAKQNHSQKQVPVGIIDSTWGGTPAEAWTSLDALQRIPGYKGEAKELQQNTAKWQQEFARNELLEKQKSTLLNNTLAYQDGQILSLDYDDASWQHVELPNPANKPLTDIVWLRKVIHLSLAPQRAQLALGAINQLGRIFINGQLVYKEAGSDIVADVPLDEHILHQGDNIITIRVANGWDNKVVVGEKGHFKLRLDNMDFDLSGLWKFSNQVEPPLPKVKYYNWKPGVLYNAMIHPLIQFPLCGVIWYQGENNVGSANLYPELFKGLITDWRAKWQRPELPFLFVQLASYKQPQAQPRQSAWAELRAAQGEALTLPNTAMAVTIDLGNTKDIHPRNKKEVANRLWLAAQHVVFAEDVVFSGPKMRAVSEFEHNGHTGLLVKYDHAQQGLHSSSSSLKGFALAGDEGHFVNAQATIVGQQVFLWSAKIKQPKRIRYAWADYSEANLYNLARLPALPFAARVE